MARFYQMILNDGVSGRRRILKHATVDANATMSTGSFGHGGAHGAHSWPTRGIVYVFMIQRAGLRSNPDDSSMRRAYQNAVAAARAQRS